VCIAVSGGIAAYKVPALVRTLKKQGCDTKVVLTRAAQPLVGEEALRTLSGHPVYTDSAPSSYDMDHIRLAQWADIMLVCPATANTIAKLAHGIADNLLTTLALAFEGPILLAPAMNSAMWRNVATQENIAVLSGRGIRVLPVEQGELACGSEGPGRMLAVEAIVEYVMAADRPQLLKGTHILIASGPTAEPLDPVRVITNRSSGKMGCALASEAIAMGASVTMVSGPSMVPPPPAATAIAVDTTAEMAAALSEQFDRCDVCIMAAAVADFKPRTASARKLKRSKSALTIELVPNPDILVQLAAQKRHQYVVGFALEDTPDTAAALKKMRDKKCDMMVLNTIGEALGCDTTAITILRPHEKPERLATMNKRDAAREILIRIAAAAGKKNG